MSIEIGQNAPNFSLPSSDKETVNLSDYQGKNLLVLFFPMAFTGVCTDELCSMRDNLSAYNQLNAEVVGISVDSPFVLNKFKSELGLNFKLLSDFNKEASTAYDCLHETFALGLKGVSKRSAFIVDKAGKVQYAEVKDVPSELPDFEAIQKKLAELN